SLTFEPPQRDVPKSLFWRQADAVGGHPLRPSFVRSIHARVARPRPFTRLQTMIREGDANETSPPEISASGHGRCRAPGPVAVCLGASLAVAAGALGRWCPRRRRIRYRRTPDGPMAVRTARPVIRH